MPRPLAEIEADIRALPLTLPPRKYRRRLAQLDAEWRTENLRLFDQAIRNLGGQSGSC